MEKDLLFSMYDPPLANNEPLHRSRCRRRQDHVGLRITTGLVSDVDGTDHRVYFLFTQSPRRVLDLRVVGGDNITAGFVTRKNNNLVPWVGPEDFDHGPAQASRSADNCYDRHDFRLVFLRLGTGRVRGKVVNNLCDGMIELIG